MFVVVIVQVCKMCHAQCITTLPMPNKLRFSESTDFYVKSNETLAVSKANQSLANVPRLATPVNQMVATGCGNWVVPLWSSVSCRFCGCQPCKYFFGSLKDWRYFIVNEPKIAQS